MKRDVADSHDYRSYSVTRPEALLDEVYVGLTERFVRFRLSGDVWSPLALPAIVRILRDPRPLYCFSCGPSAQSSSGGVVVSTSSGRLRPFSSSRCTIWSWLWAEALICFVKQAASSLTCLIDCATIHQHHGKNQANCK